MGELAGAAARIARGETTSVDEVTRALDAIERAQPTLNAFTVIARDEALAAAKDADASASRGLLHGVPVAVKDLFDVAGWPTTACSRLYDGRIGATDAPVVAALRAAGAVIVGKTNMHELAFGATGDTSSAGPANNPWDPSRMTGGSSSGSAAAVAARLVPMALGTDTGGSVRIPASLCGVTGLKTTHGLLSIDGVVPLAPTFDTVGPLTVDAVDAALALRVLAELQVQWRDDCTGIRVGIARNRSFETVDPVVDACVADALSVLEQSGATLSDCDLPDAERARDVWTDVTMPEFLRAHPGLDDALLSQELQFLARAARTIEPEHEQSARDAMISFAGAWAAAFRDVDVIVLPATPVGAPPHFAESVAIDGAAVPVHGGLLSAKTRQINVAGIPAVSVPCGMDGNGMPVGMQMAASRGAEGLLLAIVRCYQERTDWHTHAPVSTPS